MVVASAPPASIAFPGTHANAHPGSRVMDASVVNRPKYERVANPISTVPTMPNVVQIEPVDAEKVSSPTEPYALTSMNALGNLKYAAPQQPAPTPREATSAAVRPPWLEILLLSHAKVRNKTRAVPVALTKAAKPLLAAKTVCDTTAYIAMFVFSSRCSYPILQIFFRSLPGSQLWQALKVSNRGHGGLLRLWRGVDLQSQGDFRWVCR